MKQLGHEMQDAPDVVRQNEVEERILDLRMGSGGFSASAIEHKCRMCICARCDLTGTGWRSPIVCRRPCGYSGLVGGHYYMCDHQIMAAWASFRSQKIHKRYCAEGVILKG